MKLVTENPYRIVGILATATAREIQARKGKISAFAKVGKEITSEYDFSFFNSLQRTNSIIDKAFSDIEQNQNKVKHSLFWFINYTPIDNTAIQYLVSGNKEKAIEIWGKLTDEKDVTSKNFSAFNNIGTLYLLEESKSFIKKGITAKIKLIESESFQEFVHLVADENYSLDKNKQIEILIDEFLTDSKNKYSASEIMEFFSECNGTSQKYLSKKFTEDPIHKIESQIEQCTKKRSKDQINAFKYANELHINTKNELSLLKLILGSTDLQFKLLSDKIAKELLQCSIDYFNESQKQEKSNNYLEEAMKLAKLAESIAVNEITKNRVKDNLSSLEGMKDRELNNAIALLASIKTMYENAINEIDIEVAKMKMTMLYNQTINYSKINQMKADCLNWNKVVEFIIEGITINDINKIKASSSQTKINEYKDLVNFICNKISYNYQDKLFYLKFWINQPKQSKAPKSQTIKESLSNKDVKNKDIGSINEDIISVFAGIIGFIALCWYTYIDGLRGFILGLMLGIIVFGIVFGISKFLVSIIIKAMNFFNKQ